MTVKELKEHMQNVPNDCDNLPVIMNVFGWRIKLESILIDKKQNDFLLKGRDLSQATN